MIIKPVTSVSSCLYATVFISVSSMWKTPWSGTIWKSKNGNLADVSLAIQNFKKGYIIDKKSKIGLECLTYYLYGVYEKIKQENFLSSNEYIEIKSFFLEFLCI